MIHESAKQDIKRLGLRPTQISTIKKLFAAAQKAQKKTYSPYSKFAVGAAATLNKSSTQVFTGTNIENASFGATVCAERVAIWKGLSEVPNSKVQIMVLVTDLHPAASPCGICRQVLNEFSDSKTLLCQASSKFGVERIFLVQEILPGAFKFPT